MAKWLKCEITKGMFSDEFTIIVHARGGERISVFVPKSAADEEGKRVTVRVDKSREGAFAWLPHEHQSVIPVQESDLQPA